MKNEKKISELVSTIKMGELTLVDAMIFQEVLARSDPNIPTLASSLSQPPFKTSFANAWEKILEKNYVPNAAMRQMRLHYPVPLLSQILRASASGFYAWTNRPLSLSLSLSLSGRRRKCGWRW